MQTKFEYSAGETNNAAKIPHQMSLFIKQRENINTSKERLKNQPQHKDIALSQTERKDNRSKSETGFGTNIVILPNPS